MKWINIKKQKPEIIIEDGRVTGCSAPVLTKNSKGDNNPIVQQLCKGGRGDTTSEHWSHGELVTHWIAIPK